jgi:hypothetical protein
MDLAEHLTTPDCFERVGEVFDGGRAAVVGPNDRDDVEPAALLEQAVLLEKLEGGERQAVLFFQGDRLGGLALPARLDLDEDQCRAVAGDEVDLPARGPVAAHQNVKPLAPQASRGRAFASVSQPSVQKGPHDRVHGCEALPVGSNARAPVALADAEILFDLAPLVAQCAGEA